LLYAAENGHLRVVTELIEQYNIPVSIRTGLCNRTPLHFAASGGYSKVVQWKGADWNTMDKSNTNALHYAALGGQVEKNMKVFSIFIDENKRGP
jgi:ankyrin repeat protein